MKKYPVDEGQQFALVDDADYDLLRAKRWKWYERDGYCVTKVTELGKRKQYSMHRYLMRETDPLVIIDHINNNRMDNQRSNLRRFTPKQNANNTVANVHIEAFGESKTIALWVDDERCSVNYDILQKRLKNQIPAELAILAEKGEI